MSDQPPVDLSHFENLSAKTPKQVPYIIMLCVVLIPTVLVIINILAPTEAVDDLKKVKAEADVPAQVAPAGDQNADDI